MTDYLVNKTTTEVYGVKAESLKEAQDAVIEGQGDLVQMSTAFNVRLRPMPTHPTGTNVMGQPI